MNKRAIAGRALNLLVSIGIISIVFVGFFLWARAVGVQEAQEVRASADGLHNSAQLFAVLSHQVDGKPISTWIVEGDAQKLGSALRLVYGPDVACTLVLDNTKKSGHGCKPLAKAELSLNTTLATYDGKVHTVLLEVQP